MDPRKIVTHLNIPGHAHSLTFSCYHHRPYLGKDRARNWLIKALKNARIKYGYRIWAYVIMPDHLHLIVYPTNKQYDIAEFLKSVKQSVSRNAKSYLEMNNPDSLKKMIVKRGKRNVFRFWQTGPGYDLNIFVDDKLMEKIEYLHNNPVRRELIRSPVDWEWSSARWYQGHKDVPLPIDPIF